MLPQTVANPPPTEQPDLSLLMFAAPGLANGGACLARGSVRLARRAARRLGSALRGRAAGGQHDDRQPIGTLA